MGVMEFGMKLVESLPEFLFILQVLIYFGFVSFFGWIVMLGYRTYSSYPLRLGLRYIMGFLALVCGIGISGFFTWFRDVNVFLELSQMDVFISGILASLILGICVFLITRNIFNISGIKKAIERLEKRLERAEKTKRKDILRNPGFLVGISILIAFLGFSLSHFQGFPSLAERVSQEMGMSLQDFQTLFGSPQGEECVGPLILFQRYGEDIMNGKIEPYENREVKNRIEEYAGEEVKVMYRVSYQGREYVLAITQGKVCSFQNRVCSCFELAGNL